MVWQVGKRPPKKYQNRAFDKLHKFQSYMLHIILFFFGKDEVGGSNPPSSSNFSALKSLDLGAFFLRAELAAVDRGAPICYDTTTHFNDMLVVF